MRQPLEQSDSIFLLRGNVSMYVVDVMREINVREAKQPRRGIATQYCVKFVKTVKTDKIADVVLLFPS